MFANHKLPEGLVIDEKYGFVRLDPVPSEEEVERYYAEEFYARVAPERVNDSSLENMDSEAAFHRLCFENYLDLLRKCSRGVVGQKALTLFDIGCGYGHWLKFMQDKGFSVFGVEPVPEGVEWAQSQGLDVECSPIENLSKLPSRRFDIVSLLNVLEHLRDPVKALEDIANRMTASSGLLLLKVPNEFNPLQVLANEMHGLNNWWVARPQHINYFTIKSLGEALEGAGLELLSVTTTFPMELFLLLGEVYVKDPIVGKTCHEKRVNMELSLRAKGFGPQLSNLYELFASIGVGREIIAIARVRQ